MSEPQILIVAGEESGDYYGAELVHRLLELHPGIRFFGMGGERMESVGVELVHHVRDVSVMGFVEVLSRLKPLYRSFHDLVAAARTRRPQAAVFIDFPDYNLRLIPKVREATGAPTVYYIGPTVWAWRKGRVQTIKRAVDRMLVIFPFEEAIYRDAGVDVRYVGHPLVGTVRPRRAEKMFRDHYGLHPERAVLGLLPGSRRKEVAAMLPTLVAAANELAGADGAGFELALGLAGNLERADVEAHLPPGGAKVHIIENGTHDSMRWSHLCLTACGTAPLEAALLGTPQVVVYKTAPLTFGIARRLVDVPHVCMVNLILERRAVPELIQHDCTVGNVVQAARALLADGPERTAQIDAYRELRRRLGQGGAAGRAALAILETAGIEPPAAPPPCAAGDGSGPAVPPCMASSK